MQATVTKIRDAQPMGVYKPTEIDARKAAADIRIIYVGTVVAKPGLALAGRGIRQINANTYAVTERALDVLRQRYSVECDF